MFKALVTICVIGLPNNCQILEDQTGPYETEFACKQRALEISRQVHIYYPLWKPTKYNKTYQQIQQIAYLFPL